MAVVIDTSVLMDIFLVTEDDTQYEQSKNAAVPTFRIKEYIARLEGR